MCGPLLKETRTTLRLAIRWNWEFGSSPNLVIARENVGAFKVLLPEVISVLCRVPDGLKHRAAVFRAHPTSELLNQFERLLQRGLGLDHVRYCIYLTKRFGAPFCFHR